MNLPLITPGAVRHIVSNLRQRDYEEINAVTEAMEPAVLTERYMPFKEFCWFVEHEGKPAALIGAWPMSREHWKVFAFGTDAFEDVALTLTKHARRFMVPAIINAGGTRADCESLATHEKAHRWLEFLGYEKVADLPDYGLHGEDFVRYEARREIYVPEA